MKSLKSISLFILCFLFYPECLQAQDPVIYPKAYLHTDREVYFPGDSIWLKAYYLDGQTQKPVPGDYSLFIDLSDANNRIIQEQVCLLENGLSSGRIEIPDSIKPGIFMLRAYTDLQKHFGEDAFFYRILNVTSVETSMHQPVPQDAGQLNEIDVSFMPEGGYLLSGQKNVVGFKAINEKGLGIALQGEILDGGGRVVTDFGTEFQGLGAFHFIPEKGNTYHVRIREFPDYSHTFEDIVEEGIKIEYDGESDDSLRFRITTNSNRFMGASYHFAILYRGRVMFRQKFIQKGGHFPITIKKAALAAGINRFVLMDEQLIPVSERLYFSGNLDMNPLQIVPEKQKFPPRSEVRIDIVNGEEIENNGISYLSVTVADSHTWSARGPGQNILSWLLIDSELKGHIESSAHFFIDDPRLSAKDKLNLLMLTHGWSRYIWTALEEDPPEQEFVADQGLTIKGTVKHPLTYNPVADGEVEIKIIAGAHFGSAEGRTDREGRFSFDHVVFTDTATIFIQGRNKRGKLNTIVHTDPVFGRLPGISPVYTPKGELTFDNSPRLFELKYFSDLDIRNYVLEHGSILLEEVTVRSQRPTMREPFRIYTKPDNSLKITNKDYGYRNVARYLQGRVAGVVVNGNNILIRGMGSFTTTAPLFLLNGMPVPGDMIMGIPMSEIEIVEVLKPYEAGIFGSRGGSGVISVFTRRGEDILAWDYDLQGTLTQRIAGYSPFREFYSPRYTPENVNAGRPDHRLTLYWDPTVVTEQGRSTVAFFTSDDLTSYKIFVEGITESGKVCIGTGEIVVDPEQGRGINPF